jgi:hypothetical protein
MIEIEELHQITDGRAVGRFVEISAVDLRVGQVIEAARVACAQHDMVRPGATHYRLVIVVADRVVIANKVEIGRIAGTHIVVAHTEGALVDWAGRIGPVVVACGIRNPGIEVVLAFVLLLPHLIEAVERVADIRILVGNIFGDLVRRVGQVSREAGIGHVWGLALRVGRIGLRQGRVGSGFLRAEAISAGISRLLLCGFPDVWSRTLTSHNALGEQIVHLLPFHGLKYTEDIVKCIIQNIRYLHVSQMLTPFCLVCVKDY